MAKLDQDILAKTKQLAAQAENPSSAASGGRSSAAGAQSNKLEFFESEVRRLES